MTRRVLTGLTLAVLAPTVVGLAVAASSRLTAYPQATGQAARYAVAAAGFAVLASRSGGLGALRTLTVREWATLAALAAGGLVGFNLAVLGSVSRIDPALTGAIVGCSPIVLAVAGPLLARARPGAAGVAAAVVVAAGAALVESAGPRATPAGVVLALAAVAGESLFSLLAVPLIPRLGPLTLSFVIATMAAVMLAALAPFTDGAPRLPTLIEVEALLFLALPVTIGGFWAWYSALERLGAARAAPFLGLIPVAAMVGAAATGTSSWSATKLAGVVLVALAIVAGQAGAIRRRRPAPRPAPAPSPAAVRPRRSAR